MSKLKYVLFLCLLLLSVPGHSREAYRNAWRALYPDSNSDDIGPEILNPNDKGCQLCHRDDNGGDPWNVYGWNIRIFYDFGMGSTIEQAIQDAEDLDLDNDPKNATSLDEINNNFQPGWTEGNTNTLYYADLSTDTNQPPPFVPTSTSLDFPAAIGNPIPSIPVGSVEIQLHQVAGEFNAPVQAVRAPGIDGSLFVVEQTGKIFRVDLATGDKSLFHYVSDDLLVGGERGLLGLSFHPDYSNNGLFYTYQSEPKRAEQDDDVDFSTVSSSGNFDHRSMLVEYQAIDPSCNSTIRKTETLMIVDQPQSNHNGADLAFGPDGFLYISMGDGGGAGDRGFGHGAHGNGRDNTNPLGAMLRIDPQGNNSANGKYGIPADNPFTMAAGVDEIFAYGFRNPYRFSFDANSGELYVGDVGQYMDSSC